MNAAIIYQMPVNNSLLEKKTGFGRYLLTSFLARIQSMTHSWSIYTTSYSWKDIQVWLLIPNSLLKIVVFTWPSLKLEYVKYILVLFKEKTLLFWKQETCWWSKNGKEWTWLKFIWPKQWDWNIGWNEAANLQMESKRMRTFYLLQSYLSPRPGWSAYGL